MTNLADADNPAHRREQAALQMAIAEKVCPGCYTKGQWRITHTEGPVRSLRCLKCKRPDQVTA